MKITCKPTVDTQRWRSVEQLQAELAEQLVRQRGAVFANAWRTVTPPHQRGATMDSTAVKKNEGYTRLLRNISMDIAGVPSPEDVQAYATPRRLKNGEFLAKTADGQLAVPRGGFGFVVVSGGGGKFPAPIADPAAVYAGRSFVEGRSYLRGAPVVYVRPAPVKRLIKSQQKRAGKFISGWVPGLRAMGAKKVAAGFYSALAGGGSGRVSGSGTRMRGELENAAAPSAEMAAVLKKRKSWALSIARPALATNASALSAWYKKKMKALLK